MDYIALDGSLQLLTKSTSETMWSEYCFLNLKIVAQVQYTNASTMTRTLSFPLPTPCVSHHSTLALNSFSTSAPITRTKAQNEVFNTEAQVSTTFARNFHNRQNSRRRQRTHNKVNAKCPLIVAFSCISTFKLRSSLNLKFPPPFPLLLSGAPAPGRVG